MVAVAAFHCAAMVLRRFKIFLRYQMATTETRPPYCRKGNRIIARGCDSDQRRPFRFVLFGKYVGFRMLCNFFEVAAFPHKTEPKPRVSPFSAANGWKFMKGE